MQCKTRKIIETNKEYDLRARINPQATHRRNISVISALSTTLAFAELSLNDKSMSCQDMEQKERAFRHTTQRKLSSRYVPSNRRLA